MGAADQLTTKRVLGDGPREQGGIGPAARKVAFIGAGGFGTAAVTSIKAKELTEAGGVRSGLAFLAFDVLPEPPVMVATSATGEALSVMLEPGRQYLQLGPDLDPRRLSSSLGHGSAGSDNLRRLLGRQPRRRFPKSLGQGGQGERSLGVLVYLWAEPEVEGLISSTLRGLNDVRLRDSKGRLITGAPVDVFVIGSVAGAVGSATALPLCGLVKRTMAELGMPQNSFFTYIAAGPEAFPERTLRRSNACETLGDLGVAQQKGIIPRE